MRRLSRIFQLKIRCVYARLHKLNMNAVCLLQVKEYKYIVRIKTNIHSARILITNRHIIGLTSSEWKVESALKMERQSVVILYILETSRTKRLF
jgi:hypothetical protein